MSQELTDGILSLFATDPSRELGSGDIIDALDMRSERPAVCTRLQLLSKPDDGRLTRRRPAGSRTWHYRLAGEAPAAAAEERGTAERTPEKPAADEIPVDVATDNPSPRTEEGRDAPILAAEQGMDLDDAGLGAMLAAGPADLLEQARASARAALRRYLDEIDDTVLDALIDTVDTIDEALDAYRATGRGERIA